MRPKDMVIKAPPAQNQRKRGGKAELVPVRPSWNNPNKAMPEAASTAETQLSSPDPAPSAHTSAQKAVSSEPTTAEDLVETEEPKPPQITLEDAIEQVSNAPMTGMECATASEQLYCPECYLPLHPDPNPEKLYIFLHALKYTTSLGSFSTDMPEWSAEGWEWDQD